MLVCDTILIYHIVKLVSDSKIQYRLPLLSLLMNVFRPPFSLFLPLLDQNAVAYPTAADFVFSYNMRRLSTGWLWIKASTWYNFLRITHVQAPSSFLYLSLSASACHSVNFNHNSSCCQCWGLQLRLYIQGNTRGGQLHQTSAQSQYHLFSAHTLSHPKQLFASVASARMGKIFTEHEQAGIHRQTWEANAAAASEMRRNNMLMVLRGWGKKMGFGCLKCVVFSDFRSIAIRHNLPLYHPQAFSFVLTLAFR